MKDQTNEIELIDRVKFLLNEIEETHKYSMSKIYGLYNEVFDKKEQPQSCASCLIRKSNELRDWHSKQLKNKSETKTKATKKGEKNER